MNLSTFIPSLRQKNIGIAFESLNPGESLVIDAKAGTGKTTTIEWLVHRLEQSKLRRTGVCAFSKEIKKELEKRLPYGVSVLTTYSLGWRSTRNGTGSKVPVPEWTNGKKYDYLIEHWFLTKGGRAFGTKPTEVEEAMEPLVRFVRLDLVDWHDEESVRAMADRRVLDLPNFSVMYACLKDVLEWGINGLPKKDSRGNTYDPESMIDFVDQIWLPNVLDFPVEQFDVLFVDEAQDLSKAQLELLMKARHSKTISVFVGDPHQAIFGFAGADPDSFAQIVRRTDATVMPLDVCYRSGQQIIALAQTIVPDIYAAPTAKQGSVLSVNEMFFDENVTNRDMVICRTTAPLIETAFSLIRQGKKAKVKGRDIGAQVKKVVDAIAKQPFFKFENFTHHALMYRQQQADALGRKENAESLIQSLYDKVESVIAVYDNSQMNSNPATSIEDLRVIIDSLFTEDEYGVILLLTIHRAKGLEADRVFLLKPHLLPHPMANTPDGQQQELHLEYVAITRAKSQLFIVTDPKYADRGTNARLPKEGESLVPVAFPEV